MDTLQAISVGATQAVRIYVSKVTSILSPREAHFSPYDDFILAAPSRLASLIRTGIAKYSNTGVQEWIVQIGSNEDLHFNDFDLRGFFGLGQFSNNICWNL